MRAGRGLSRPQTHLPDLIQLDIMLPGLTGTEILRELRGAERTRESPILILSARTEETDQVVGFSLGADDYVTKPFSPRVPTQRLEAIQRRIEGTAERFTSLFISGWRFFLRAESGRDRTTGG